MRKAKILVAEDDPRIVVCIEDQLEYLGYQVMIARNGVEALEKVKENKPDLILLDVMMPEMDGYEVCQRLKSSPDTKDIPILMLTAKGQLQDKVEGFSKGTDDYLPKPYDRAELEARIRALLKRTNLLPFSTNRIRSVLSISFKPNHRLNIRLNGNVTFTAKTKNPLDIDTNVVDRYGKNTPVLDWRFSSKQIGNQLYQKFLVEHPKILSAYNQAVGSLTTDEELHLHFESDRDSLRVPIEFIFGDGDYFVLRHPLSRSISDVRVRKKSLSPNFFNDLWRNEEQLRILLVASNTGGISGVDYEIINLESLLKTLFTNIGFSVYIEAIPTDEATYSAMRDELKKCRYHIIHYAGHGSHDTESPENSSIFFWENTNSQGEVKSMPVHELQMLLRESNVRFVYLSCCNGTAVSENSKLLDDDFLGIADGLTMVGIPSVLGFRWPVSDEGAVNLAQEFYKNLAETGEIDTALLNARCEIAAKNRDDLTWLSPILIMQDYHN
jgi:DNA-binding response OmpR family regulator